MTNEAVSKISLTLGVVLGVFCSWLLFGILSEHGHCLLGSSGHTCFANKTCRSGLVCAVVDGAEDGICTKTVSK